MLSQAGFGRVWVVLGPLLALLLLVALPVYPETETASAELRVAPVEEAATRLGEGSPGLSEPPEDRPAATTTGATNAGGAMRLTVPRLGLKDVAVPTGQSQRRLDREGIIHVAGSGVPWQPGSNTFIVGHALGFPYTKVPYVFYELEKMRPGDEILVRDTAGRTYRFRVYDLMTVRPSDYWATYPVEGETTISLQTCVNPPDFDMRLVVRGQLIS